MLHHAAPKYNNVISCAVNGFYISTVLPGALKSRKEFPRFNGLRFSNGFYYRGGSKLCRSTSSIVLNINEVLLLFIQKITTHQIINNQSISKHPLLSLHPI